jgi:hypothetical protein
MFQQVQKFTLLGGTSVYHLLETKYTNYYFSSSVTNSFTDSSKLLPIICGFIRDCHPFCKQKLINYCMSKIDLQIHLEVSDSILNMLCLKYLF